MNFRRFSDIGVKVPEIILPSDEIDMSKWAVVACDQYTSELEYWEKADEIAGNSPSALRLILPEVFLEMPDSAIRIERINKAMNDYLQKNLLKKLSPGFIYVERTFSSGHKRKGLVICLDLEYYDYSPASKTLIRATEGTVIDRLPPRMEIRKDAALELPHIMVLIDDPEKTVIEPLSDMKSSLLRLYSFDLMLGGGSIEGYHVNTLKQLDMVEQNLIALANKKYEAASLKDDILLFAMGDGNHSLASARGHWLNLKKTLPLALIENHPARYALVEIVNIHDSGIIFEPIHRVLFNTEPERFMYEFVNFCKLNGSMASIQRFDSFEEAVKFFEKPSPDSRHYIPYSTGGSFGLIIIDSPFHTLTAGMLQPFCDGYLNRNPQCRIDYIHGTQALLNLSATSCNLGLHLPPIDKNDFFRSIQQDGILPRKTFSMGEAPEKRYYIECRSIVSD